MSFENFNNLTIGQLKLLTEQFVEIAKTTNLFNKSPQIEQRLEALKISCEDLRKVLK